MASSPPSKFNPDFLVGDQIKVSRIGYGAMRLTGKGMIGLPDDIAGAIRVLQEAVEQGIRFFDTANAYGPRTVNQIIGRSLAPLADDIVIGNKVGARRDATGGWVVDNRPETIRNQVEDALMDTRAECSQLTYLRLWGDVAGQGEPPPEASVPVEEALGVLTRLREEGKVRHIGLSGATPESLARAQKVMPIAAVQNRFNLMDRSGVVALEACERDGIAFVPYFPLAAGRMDDIEPLVGAAQRLEVSVSVIALAWLLRRSRVLLPIPGTTSSTHLSENISALQIAPLLTEDEVQAMTNVRNESSATLNGVPL